MQDIIEHLERDPHQQFLKWLEMAKAKQISEWDAVSLATVDSKGQPHQRTVLYKGMNEKGFLFYTNYSSAKARDMDLNPHVSLLFYWKKPLGYQVRIEGKVEKIDKKASEEYFHSRPRQSQLAAVASNQSSVLENRKSLEEAYAEAEKKYQGKEIPLPEDWGGYVVVAHAFDFMILDRYRLHDRFRYEKVASLWEIKRLAP